MKEHRVLTIWDCLHCPYNYRSITTNKRRCAFSSRNFDDEDEDEDNIDYSIPKWCKLPMGENV